MFSFFYGLSLIALVFIVVIYLKAKDEENKK